MLQSDLAELHKREVRGSLVLCVLGALLILVSYPLDWESGLGIYRGFLGSGTLLAGVLVVPINKYLRWLDDGAPDWFRKIGFLVMFMAGCAGAVLVVFVIKRF